jgi:hypothetical protein
VFYLERIHPGSSLAILVAHGQVDFQRTNIDQMENRSASWHDREFEAFAAPSKVGVQFWHLPEPSFQDLFEAMEFAEGRGAGSYFGQTESWFYGQVIVGGVSAKRGSPDHPWIFRQTTIRIRTLLPGLLLTTLGIGLAAFAHAHKRRKRAGFEIASP